MNHVEIRTGLVFGSRSSNVEIDGHDIVNGISGVTVRAKVGEITTVEISMPVTKTTTHTGKAIVFLAAETVDALVALGWTPPGETP